MSLRHTYRALRIVAATALVAALLTGVAFAGEGYTRNVAIVIWNGAEILDWGGPSEVFESAARIGAQGQDRAFNVYTVSKTTESIKSQRFIEVIPQFSILDAPKPDIIVLPGGGTSSVLQDPEFLEWAGQAAAGSEVALSVCTGAFILAKSGLLEGKDATTWYGALDNFEEQYPETNVRRGSRFVDNGQIVTTAGVSAGIDGSLHVVARLLGRYVADRTAQYMEYGWTPEPYLAREYALLNPSTNDQGRAVQQADIHAAEKNWPAAIGSYNELVEANPDDDYCWFQLATAYYSSEQYTEAAPAFIEAADSQSFAGRAYYNAACSASLANDKDHAFEYLAQSIDAGMTNAEWMRKDTDLENLHGDPRFDSLLNGIQ